MWKECGHTFWTHPSQSGFSRDGRVQFRGTKELRRSHKGLQ